MIVRFWGRARKFWLRYPEARIPLLHWKRHVQAAQWKNFADVRQTFRSADWLGDDRIVFDIAGNNYRLMAVVVFINERIYVKKVMTHEEYEKEKW